METNKDFNNKKRLGRGLGSLLGGQEAQGLADYSNKSSDKKTELNSQNQTLKTEQNNESTAHLTDENRFWKIAVDKLVPGLYQPRKNFEKESLQQLAESIKQNGILQPITVRKRASGGYEIIAGERRWRAAQIAGLHEVPAIIKQVTDREALQLALIENVQREDLDVIEEAESYQRLAEEFSMSQQEVAEKVGKERSTVANALRMLQLPREIKEMIILKQISSGHAKVLLSLTDKTSQIRFSKQIIENELSVRALEKLIKSAKNKTLEPETDKTLNIDMASKLANELADQLQKTLGTKVEINYKSGKGQVNIHFYSDDQLTQVYEKLKA